MFTKTRVALVVLCCAGSALQAQTAATPHGALVGTVLTERTEKPVVDAEIALTGLTISVRSDSAGNFSMLDVPVGTYQLTVRALGYAAFSGTFTFRDNITLSRDFILKRTSNTLATVDVTARAFAPARSPLAEFDERRVLGLGRYLTRDVFEKADGRKLTDVLIGAIPGIIAVANNSERSIAANNRGNISLSNKPGQAGKKTACYVQVVIDNIVRYRSTPGETLFDIDSVDPITIAGIEFYTVSQTPLQFNSTGGAPCGTMVIWTKR